MTTTFSSSTSRKKLLTAIGIPVLVAAWWAFRPEKLWINQQVNEAAPFATSGDAQPLYTGQLEGKAHPTSGRASIYAGPGGEQYLRLTDFRTSNGPDVHVLLARAEDKNLSQEIVKGGLDSVELGSLQGNVGDQNYKLQNGVDLHK